MIIRAIFGWLIAVLLVVGPARAAGLGGGYFGIDDAHGLRIDLAPHPEIPGQMRGLFTDALGPHEFVAVPVSQSSDFETRVELGGNAAYLRLIPQPAGLMITWAPISAEGQVLIEQTRRYAFLRDGTVLPRLPEHFVEPPARDGDPVDISVFLDNYEFWEPIGVGRGYEGIGEKYRVMIRLFPRVQADVLWKLCQARATPPGLAKALEGQNATCADILQAVAQAQARGNFGRLKADMAAEKQVLIDAVNCGRGVRRAQDCVAVSRRTAEAAISMETAASVLARYR